MLENSERSVRMGKSGPLKRAELANQIQGFRIPDRWDASEKNKSKYFLADEYSKNQDLRTYVHLMFGKIGSYILGYLVIGNLK